MLGIFKRTMQLTFIQNRDFICHWPGCRLKTKDRNQIEFHHIVPRELHPRLNQGVTLSYCPSHHRMIFHPESTKGPHSINSPNKLQILNIYPVAPSGYAVEYKRFNDEIFFEFFEGDYRNGEVELAVVIIIQTVVGFNDTSTISSNDLCTYSFQPQYNLCGPTIQASNTVDTGMEEKQPVCTNEEWEKFCEEEGLEDGNVYTNDFYTTTATILSVQ